jgi:hypothetical protein
LPGRTPAAADEAFLAPLRRALNCLTDVQLYASRPAKPGDVRVLALSENPLRLRSSIVAGGLLLRLLQQFRSVEEPKAPRSQRWHVSTVQYDYRLSRVEDGKELLAWHWHPDLGVPHPHLHAGVSDEISRRLHLPCGRVSIESVLRLLLGELGVRAKREDWPRVLDEAEAPFIQYRRWSSWPAATPAAPPAES